LLAWLSTVRTKDSKTFGNIRCTPSRRRHGALVNFPDPFCGIPFAARLFDTALQFGFPEFHSQSDNLRLFRRRPVGFFDDDFDSREAFPPLIVIAIADPRSAACHNVRGTSSCLSDLESMSAEPA
jgi:hypothetical protein